MKTRTRKSTASIFVLGLVLFTAWLTPVASSAQSVAERLIGSWRMVSLYNEQDGVRIHTYGEKPIGLVVYDRAGYVMQYLSKPDVPKFATANRLKGTDAEYRAVMQSILSGFGTYTVDGNTVTVHWIASSYPNRVGTREKRSVTVVGDQLSITNTTASSGGTSVSTYVRVK